MTTIKIVSKNRKHFAKAPFLYKEAYRFTEDESCADYDWLVVFDDLKADCVCDCPRERTILATWEPVSIKNYATVFTRQFGHLLTNRPYAAERHPHYHLGRGYFPWYNSRNFEENRNFVVPPKTKLISAVCSSKRMRWTQHGDRIALLRKCQAEIPGMEWYGWGVNAFDRKCEVMDAYRYHIAFENHIAPHYWSEKIADAFLSECLPFYAGAPNLAEDFPEESFIPIPANDPDAAIRIIREAIANDEWSKRIEAIREARSRLLSKYNFFAQVIRLIEAEAGQSVSDGNPPVLHPRKYFRLHSLSANWEDGLFHLRQYLSGVGLWKRIS